MKIDWGGHDGELVERVIACMLQQDRPDAWRRRPSKGDGGVDILERLDDGTFEIFQVKSYTGPLTSKRKKDIAGSFTRVTSSFEGTISKWNLILPMDPSREAEKWFRELTENADFACHWRGEVVVDGLAANHPHVIDYYLRDGRGRLEAMMGEWGDIVAVLRDPRAAVPADIVDTLGTLFTPINRDDPHFKFDLAVNENPPPISGPHPNGLVLSVTREVPGGSFVTVHVFERYRGALEDRPVTGSFTISAPADSELASEVESFFKYGTPVDLPAGSLQRMVLDAPGGLATTAESGQGKIGPATGDGYELRVVIVNPANESIAESKLKMEPSTHGTAGTSIRGVEENNVFKLRGVFDFEAQRANLVFSIGEVSGRPVTEIATGIRTLAALEPPNEIRFAPPYGGPSIPGGFPIAEMDPLVEPWLPELVDDLVAIQEISVHPVRLPAEFASSFLRGAREAARLIRGETLTGSWTRCPIHLLPDGVDAIEEGMGVESAFRVDQPLSIDIDGVVHELGTRVTVLPSGVIEDVESVIAALKDGKETDAVVVPGSDDSYSQKLLR